MKRFPNKAPALHLSTHLRVYSLLFVFVIFFAVVIARLFYWQVTMATRLSQEATTQYSRVTITQPHRGKIFTSDGFTVVTNKKVHRLIFQPLLSNIPLEEVVSQIAESLSKVKSDSNPDQKISELEIYKNNLKQQLYKRLDRPEARWLVALPEVNEEEKKALEKLKLKSLLFENYEVRDYPESSMAAHVVGFVGQNVSGEPQGYFGVEGKLDELLRGEQLKISFLLDGLGFRSFFGSKKKLEEAHGSDVVLTIRRDVQFLLESKLLQAVERYEAKSGEIVVMEPTTGKILGMATYPAYSPGEYRKFEQELYKNPAVAAGYEPGSIFKVLTVAAGVDAGAFDGETVCSKCSGARSFGEYSVKTFDEKYHSNITIRDGLAKSDNVAMVFASDLIGKDKFLEYITKFGIGEKIGFELQEDTPTVLKKEWRPLDVATASFGQGILTTSLQMTRAISAIANDGVMMQPIIVEKTINNNTGVESLTRPVEVRRVISSHSAQETKKIMEYATTQALHKWQSNPTHSVAGKTGTAQIFKNGEYNLEQTVTSYVGFSPIDKPKFVMIVKLTEPQLSSWADKTAAPVWFEIAQELYLLLNIPPDLDSRVLE